MGQPVVHFEIEGLDGERLQAFYSELFGWRTSGAESNPDYALVPREDNLNPAGVGIGGAISSVPDRPSTSWRGPRRRDGYQGHVTIYVEVADVKEALLRAESLGGTRALGPDQIPGGPEIGAFNDPEGHLIGLVSAGQPNAELDRG